MAPLRFEYGTSITCLGLTTQAPKTLAEAGITTVGQLLDRGHAAVAELRGMGASRFADIERALEEHRLSFDKPLPDLSVYATCKRCPACETCGMPRATETKHVATDVFGRAKHATAPGNPCNDCDKHHRALFASAAAG